MEQRWIPVSERLPDADKYILVSIENFIILDIGRYETDKDGKQTKDIPPITFVYDDVRVLKRKDDTQVRPDHYTRYVFKVADGQSNMGSIVGYDSRPAGEGGLVYDVIGGTKAYQMPLPQDPVAKQGYEFAGWTSKIYIDNVSGGQTESDGFKRLPILSEFLPNALWKAYRLLFSVLPLQFHAE